MGREGREKTERVRKGEQEFLKYFLLDLPKVPSHYCRSSLSKMHLDVFKPISHVHTQYKHSSEEHGIQPQSGKEFSNTFAGL